MHGAGQEPSLANGKWLAYQATDRTFIPMSADFRLRRLLSHRADQQQALQRIRSRSNFPLTVETSTRLATMNPPPRMDNAATCS